MLTVEVDNRSGSEVDEGSGAYTVEPEVWTTRVGEVSVVLKAP